MRMVKKYKTPLQRQIGEALLIERRSWTADCLMNKKGEWNGTKVPRIRMESVEEEKENEDIEHEERSKERERRSGVRKNWRTTEASKRKVIEVIDHDSTEVLENSEGYERDKRKKQNKRARRDVQKEESGSTEKYREVQEVDTENTKQKQEEGENESTKEVDSKTVGNFPESVPGDEEYNWQEEELLVEMGKQLDRERRQE